MGCWRPTHNKWAHQVLSHAYHTVYRPYRIASSQPRTKTTAQQHIDTSVSRFLDRSIAKAIQTPMEPTQSPLVWLSG
jgi:hypothetical protein